MKLGEIKITSKHISKVAKALRSNRLSYGPMTEEFEKKVAKLHGNKYGVMTNSGTSALQVVIHAMKIMNGWKDGDEIIVPATTFVATYNVVIQNRLKPKLVDIGTDFNIDVELIEGAITKRTRAIMPVHLLGKVCDMKAIKKIAKKHNLKVIEDSCESMLMKGIGTGDAACFSFYSAHLITTGVGGMVITNDKKLATLVRSLIFHGRDPRYLTIDDKEVKNRFTFHYPGYSYRSTEMEAAMGLVELESLKDNIKKRQSIALKLHETFGVVDKEYFDNNACMLFPILTQYKEVAIKQLEKAGIETRDIMPLINQPYLKVNKSKYPVSWYLLESGMLIGCHPYVKQSDINKIKKILYGV